MLYPIAVYRDAYARGAFDSVFPLTRRWSPASVLCHSGRCGMLSVTGMQTECGGETILAVWTD